MARGANTCAGDRAVTMFMHFLYLLQNEFPAFSDIFFVLVLDIHTLVNTPLKKFMNFKDCCTMKTAYSDFFLFCFHWRETPIHTLVITLS